MPSKPNLFKAFKSNNLKDLRKLNRMRSLADKALKESPKN